MREKRNKKKRTDTSLNKVSILIDNYKGRDNDKFDGAYPDKQDTFKTVSTENNKNLFNKCVEFDFEYLLSRKFLLDRQHLENVLVQSVLGRALNGHGWFIDDDGIPLKFKDATFDKVCTVLERMHPHLNNLDVRRFRNREIEKLTNHIFAHMNQDNIPLYTDTGGLFGVKFLEDKSAGTLPFLKGMVLAGYMDNYGYRRKTIGRYKKDLGGNDLNIGGGSIYVVNRRKFKDINLGDTGRGEFTSANIRYLIELGVIKKENRLYKYPEYDQAFFRLRDGEGVSDDLAMMYICRQYGFDGMLGAFIMDAVDTYDKFLMEFKPGGMDGNTADRLQEYFIQERGAPLVSNDEIMELIYFACKLNVPSVNLSSSHRRFVQVENGADKPTLLMHRDFLKGREMPEFKLGFNRVSSHNFYNDTAERFSFTSQVD